MPYRELRADKITATIDRLSSRISERFNDSGLSKVAAELAQLSKVAAERAEKIARPNLVLRIAIAVAVAAVAAALVALASTLPTKFADDNLSGLLQGIESMLQIIILASAGLFFLISYEDRLKRQGALKYLHELRSLVHVIDMHQLTKDPSAMLGDGPSTPSSPLRTMTPFELVRYLDYSSELLSLSSKVAAIYSQATRDAVVGAAVNEVEQLTTNLSAKIWQKIRLIEDRRQHDQLTARPSAPKPPAAPMS